MRLHPGDIVETGQNARFIVLNLQDRNNTKILGVETCLVSWNMRGAENLIKDGQWKLVTRGNSLVKRLFGV